MRFCGGKTVIWHVRAFFAILIKTSGKASKNFVALFCGQKPLFLNPSLVAGLGSQVRLINYIVGHKTLFPPQEIIMVKKLI